MKSSHRGLAVLGLALVGLWYAGGGTAVPTQSAAASELPQVSAPLSHDNLTVFFIHGNDTIKNAKIGTLQEALEGKWAVVHETSNVNALAVENLSPDTELFIQEGDMIRGGKQDRMIAEDMLIPPKSGRVSFPVHCVESGRWTARGNEDTAHFAKSDQFAVGNELRYANARHQQGQVWDNVRMNQDKLSANLGVKVNAAESATSFQLTLENKALQAKVAEFEQALLSAGESRENVIGVVFVVNGQLVGHEEYGSNALFQKAWPKLLRSASVSAIADKTARRTPAPPSSHQVACFLAFGGPQEAPKPPVDATSNEYLRVLIYNRELAGVRHFGQIESLHRGQENIRDGAAASPGSGANDDPLAPIAPLAPPLDGRRVAGNVPTLGPLSFATEMNAPMSRTPHDNRQFFNISVGLFGGPGDSSTLPTPVATPANRLNVNRVEDAAGLVSEARDPSRDNAVIHKSFIKVSGR